MTAPAPIPFVAGSVLSPVLVGLSRTDNAADLLGVVWAAARGSVPPMVYSRTVIVKEKRQKVEKTLTQRRTCMAGSGGGYSHIVRLCDARPGTRENWQVWRWEVSAKVVTDPALLSFAGNPESAIRIDTTGFRLRAGTVVESATLALFRHHVVAGFKALDPAATVVGGQHDWDDGWWTVADKHAIYE